MVRWLSSLNRVVPCHVRVVYLHVESRVRSIDLISTDASLAVVCLCYLQLVIQVDLLKLLLRVHVSSCLVISMVIHMLLVSHLFFFLSLMNSWISLITWLRILF